MPLHGSEVQVGAGTSPLPSQARVDHTGRGRAQRLRHRHSAEGLRLEGYLSGSHLGTDPHALPECRDFTETLRISSRKLSIDLTWPGMLL